MQGLVIYGPDGEEAKRATLQEQKDFDSALKAQADKALFDAICRAHEHRLDKKMYKGFRDKGLQQNHTRSSFAHRMRNKRASAEKFESFSERTDKYGNRIPASADWKDWDYAPVGEGTLWRLVPRMSYKDLDIFDVWVVRVAENGRKRRRCTQKGFKRDCGDATCGRMTCARCWAVENLEVKDSETIVVKRREGPRPRVVDPTGVHPKGVRGAGQDMGEDQRAIFGLTSSIHSHKEGASEQGVGTILKRDPADGKKFNR